MLRVRALCGALVVWSSSAHEWFAPVKPGVVWVPAHLLFTTAAHPVTGEPAVELLVAAPLQNNCQPFPLGGQMSVDSNRWG